MNLRTFLLCALLFSMASCSYKLLPPAPLPGMADRVTGLSDDVRHLYTSIKESTDKSYSIFAPKYLAISEQLLLLHSINQVRKNGEPTVKMLRNITLLFDQHQAQHKARDGLISESELEIFATSLRDAISPLINAERALEY